jgi:hypothetical protein
VGEGRPPGHAARCPGQGTRAREEGSWDEGDEREYPRMAVSNMLDLLHLPNFTHFRGEGGDGGAAVDSLMQT